MVFHACSAPDTADFNGLNQSLAKIGGYYPHK